MFQDANVADQTAPQRVASHLREMIRERSIPVGGVLPNYHQLCVDLDVSYMTVKLGMDILAAEGLVRRVPSKGTFVAKSLVREAHCLDQVGLIFPSSRSLLYTSGYLLEIMQGITQAAPASGDLHIFSIREQGLADAAHLGAWTVGGALLLGVENDEYLRRFASWNVPGVVVDYCPRDVPLDYFACDNAAAARQVVAHLAGLGHRRVAYLAANPRSEVRDSRQLRATLLVKESSDARERLEFATAELRASGMLKETWLPPNTPREFAAFLDAHLSDLQRRADRPTAILADSDSGAVMLAAELRRRDLRVPEDVSLAAVGGCAEFARRDHPGITCCHFDFAGMGRMAMERLVERCRGTEAQSPRACRIGFQFVAGTTTAPVCAHKGGGA